MRVKVQLVMGSAEGEAETVADVIILDKYHRRLEHLRSLNCYRSSENELEIPGWLP